jgi:tRNA pseudouridine55 synthase
MYSALKQGGKKLYELARAGETVERAARPVTIEAIRLTDWNPPQFTLDVTCSAGTYIRSLAYDLGETLNVGAHLAALTRTGSGSFLLENALDLTVLLSDPDWQNHLVSPRVALAHFPSIELTPQEVSELRLGRGIPRNSDTTAETVMAYLGDELAAIVQPREGRWQPAKVFAAQ